MRMAGSRRGFVPVSDSCSWSDNVLSVAACVCATEIRYGSIGVVSMRQRPNACTRCIMIMQCDRSSSILMVMIDLHMEHIVRVRLGTGYGTVRRLVMSVRHQSPCRMRSFGIMTMARESQQCRL